MLKYHYSFRTAVNIKMAEIKVIIDNKTGEIREVQFENAGSMCQNLMNDLSDFLEKEGIKIKIKKYNPCYDEEKLEQVYGESKIKE